MKMLELEEFAAIKKEQRDADAETKGEDEGP